MKIFLSPAGKYRPTTKGMMVKMSKDREKVAVGGWKWYRSARGHRPAIPHAQNGQSLVQQIRKLKAYHPSPTDKHRIAVNSLSYRYQPSSALFAVDYPRPCQLIQEQPS